MSSNIIYHPQRVKSVFSGVTIYHDKTTDNQDPYVWNDPFLHTFCHMPELKNPKPGDTNFWVSGDTFPDFNHLYCDLVFVIKEKCYWENANSINSTDPLVDSKEAYQDHYKWVQWQHEFKNRKRFTLKADPLHSFQYQDQAGSLIDIVPILNSLGFPTDQLHKALKKGFASKPMPLDPKIARELHSAISKSADMKLTCKQLQSIRKKHHELASPRKKNKKY